MPIATEPTAMGATVWAHYVGTGGKLEPWRLSGFTADGIGVWAGRTGNTLTLWTTLRDQQEGPP